MGGTIHYHGNLLAMLFTEDVVEKRAFAGSEVA